MPAQETSVYSRFSREFHTREREEARLALLVLLGEGHPELKSMQQKVLHLERPLPMDGASAGGEPVDFSRGNLGLTAGGIAVEDSALQQIGQGGDSDVRMWALTQRYLWTAAGRRDRSTSLLVSCLVEEEERTYPARAGFVLTIPQLGRRNHAPHLHPSHLAEAH